MKNKINLFLNNLIVDKLLIFLISANLIVFIADTDITFHNNFAKFISYFELISVGIFTTEYILRVIVLEKFKDIFKPLMVIDLLAIVPFYLSFVAVNTIFLRILRLFRLMRIFKISRYTDAFENIKESFSRKKNELIVTGMIFISGIIISSIFIYYAENGANPQGFPSIPASFWWSVVTFTSVGYGDVYPVTVIGKIIGSMTAVMGVGLHGLLVAIIGAAFMELLGKDKSASGIINNNKEKDLVNK